MLKHEILNNDTNTLSFKYKRNEKRLKKKKVYIQSNKTIYKIQNKETFIKHFDILKLVGYWKLPFQHSRITQGMSRKLITKSKF